jgi:predicted O-methyltransferase YrrM
MSKLYNALLNPKSFLREVIRCGWLDRRRNPESWFQFRHIVTYECALRRRMLDALPTRNLREALGKELAFGAKLTYDEQTPYNLSWNELVVISQIVSSLAPHCLFEFGTFNGRTTLHLALNSPEDASIYTLDIKEGAFDFGADTPFFRRISVGECFKGTPVEGKITMIVGDSHTFDFARWSKSVDFIFIDGDHSFDGVMCDSQAAFSMIRHGGVIVWHDYLAIDDVTRAIAQLSQNYCLCRISGTSLVYWRDEAGGQANI